MHKPQELEGKTIETAELGLYDKPLVIRFTDGWELTVRPSRLHLGHGDMEDSLDLTYREEV